MFNKESRFIRLTNSRKLKFDDKIVIVLIIALIALVVGGGLTHQITLPDLMNSDFVTIAHPSTAHSRPDATERVRQMRGYNTQAYATAKSLKEQMNVLNKAYAQGDIRSLRQINKLDRNNFTNLALNAALYHEAKSAQGKKYAKQKDAAMERVMVDMSNMSFKNRSVKKRYAMFSEDIIKEINQIVQAKDHE